MISKRERKLKQKFVKLTSRKKTKTQLFTYLHYIRNLVGMSIFYVVQEVVKSPSNVLSRGSQFTE